MIVENLPPTPALKSPNCGPKKDPFGWKTYEMGRRSEMIYDTKKCVKKRSKYEGPTTVNALFCLRGTILTRREPKIDPVLGY